jgi:hypothetical protein
VIRLLGVLVVVLVVGAGCRSPGNPPQRPAQGEYQDIIRRELDSAGSALATSELVLRYAATDRIPPTYADVVLRQAANDLRKVAQDIRAIHAPRRAGRAQRHLLLICERDGTALANLRSHFTDADQRRLIRSRVARDAKLLDTPLAAQLDPR